MAWFSIADLLEAKGWSMKRFAGELGVKPQVVTRYFKPGFDPNASTLLKWTRILDCSLNDLVDESGDESKKLMRRPESATAKSGKKPEPKKKPKRPSITKAKSTRTE